MSSFLQKLKGKGVQTEDRDHAGGQVPAQLPAKSEIPSGVTQLPVDVYQNDNEIVIYAQVPGVEIKDLDVSIEGDNDVITVQGHAHRPHDLVQLRTPALVDGANVPIGIGVPTSMSDEHTQFTLEECPWGKFFRQIILPQEVDAPSALAKIKDGVLVLHLPLKGHSSNRIRMQVQRYDQPTQQ